MTGTRDGAPGVCAVVPVKDLRETKSRLRPVLAAGARAGLTLRMMGRVVAALRDAGVAAVCVVSPDGVVLEEAGRLGAVALRQESRGLNPALGEGRRWAIDRGSDALLVLPADLPLLEAPDVRALLHGVPASDGPSAPSGPSVVIAPDGAGSGTNALVLRPPDAVPFSFGPGSFGAHLGAARERDLGVRVVRRPRLAFDLDTAGDLSKLGGPAAALATETPRW